ncbi:type IV toxin-antitoxin system AbiEi family antitoxin domain-containing protein [Leucobacter chromiireducens]|uniref:type IV toxin-antitoxin system AbiEi family antitoxin domain-containing protein n=1 Tax=Leucobacter chromiireducens TaxID=283877 RepID=UPI0013DE7936|nr:type IV toxin-antitoxin system AbiEi family antitoxin domain-containing protein [Leucobacter chromiireducens]
MKSEDALLVIAEITASQWGMVTAAQAGVRGVDRLTLARLADAGHLERLAHGVYRDAGAPSDQFEDLRVAWLSTEPKRLAEERIRDGADGVVVASTSAAMLHGIGDLWANLHEFVVPKRRQTQRVAIRYRQRVLDAGDVTIVEGLPAMTLERTVADLLDDVGDMSLVADGLKAAAGNRRLDLDRLTELIAPLAERNGFRRYDGSAALNRLMEIASLDVDSMASRIPANSALGSKILENYLKAIAASVPLPDMSAFTRTITPQLLMDEKTWRFLAESPSRDLIATVAPHLTSSLIENFSQMWVNTSASPRARFGSPGALTDRQEHDE